MEGIVNHKYYNFLSITVSTISVFFLLLVSLANADLEDIRTASVGFAHTCAITDRQEISNVGGIIARGNWGMELAFSEKLPTM